MPQNKDKRFTADEIEFIKYNIDKMTVQEIADALGRTERGVRGKIERLGIKLSELERNKPYEWTKKDIETLKQHYQSYSDEKLVEKFFPHLSVHMILRKRKKLGLDKQHGQPYVHAGYWCISVDGGKQWVHKMEAEKKIGRKLKKSEVVHHVNGDKLDNRHENLYVCDKRGHGLAHDSLEKAAFELYRLGYITFDHKSGEYKVNIDKLPTRTEG